MLLNVYLWGALVTAVGALMASYQFAGVEAERPLGRAAVAVVAGALWPVLVVGAAQFVAIAALVRVMRKRAEPAPFNEPPVLREEPLLASV